jgi:hypothetical protein
MESLLALTIFRSHSLSPLFAALFASLVFVKVMHWLLQVGAARAWSSADALGAAAQDSGHC